MDENGVPVQGAEVSALFVRDDTLHDEKSKRGLTDADGNVKLTGKSTGEILYRVWKGEEYHDSFGRCWFYLPRGHKPAAKEVQSRNYGMEHYGDGVSEIASGWWVPSERKVTVVLKKMKKAEKMTEVFVKLKFPDGTDQADFDCEVFDWTAPYGQGKQADIRVQFICQATNVSGHCEETQAVTLSFGEAGGCISRPRDLWSMYSYLQEAPPDGYMEKIVYQKHLRDGRTVSESKLEDVDHLIFRTRVHLDEEGDVLSANYGVIGAFESRHINISPGVGKWREKVDPCEGYDTYHKEVSMWLWLNLEPNDLNLDKGSGMSGGRYILKLERY